MEKLITPLPPLGIFETQKAPGSNRGLNHSKKSVRDFFDFFLVIFFRLCIRDFFEWFTPPPSVEKLNATTSFVCFLSVREPIKLRYFVTCSFCKNGALHFGIFVHRRKRQTKFNLFTFVQDCSRRGIHKRYRFGRQKKCNSNLTPLFVLSDVQN